VEQVVNRLIQHYLSTRKSCLTLLAVRNRFESNLKIPPPPQSTFDNLLKPYLDTPPRAHLKPSIHITTPTSLLFPIPTRYSTPNHNPILVNPLQTPIGSNSNYTHTALRQSRNARVWTLPITRLKHTSTYINNTTPCLLESSIFAPFTTSNLLDQSI
jgi:hypothetical protein